MTGEDWLPHDLPATAARLPLQKRKAHTIPRSEPRPIFRQLPVLYDAARRESYLNINLDPDGAARSYPTVVNLKHQYCVPLFLALVDAYAQHAPQRLRLDTDGVAGTAIGGDSIAVGVGCMVVHFRGPREPSLGKRLPTSSTIASS